MGKDGTMEQSKRNRSARPAEELKFHKNKYAAPVGGVFILLALIGLIALGAFCVQFTRSILDNSGEKEMFEDIITPVLMFDPVPFEKVSDTDPVFLLQSSLWSTMLGEKRDSYKFDALGRLIVPASDVDVTCARLFGPDVKLQHQTFGDYEVTYVYDDSTKTYYAPVNLQANQYMPSVERVVKKGDVFTLTVGYIPPANAWTQSKNGESNEPVPVKEMIYELVKNKKSYQLVAIRDVPKSSTSSSAQANSENASASMAPSAAPAMADTGTSYDETDETEELEELEQSDAA